MAILGRRAGGSNWLGSLASCKKATLLPFRVRLRIEARKAGIIIVSLDRNTRVAISWPLASKISVRHYLKEWRCSYGRFLSEEPQYRLDLYGDTSIVHRPLSSLQSLSTSSCCLTLPTEQLQ